MRIIGIDPGASGALAIRSDKGVQVFRFNNTANFTKNDEWIYELGNDFDAAYIEDVHSFTGQGVKSIFSFGKNLGHAEMILKMSRIPWETVTPQLWQKTLSLTGPYDNRKQMHVKRALELCPDYAKWVDEFPPKSRNKQALDTADAILIAEYGYRKEMQKWSYENGI